MLDGFFRCAACGAEFYAPGQMAATQKRASDLSQPALSGPAQSVQARLRNAAQDAGRPFAELLELYAVERLLHRLGCSRQRER